MTLPQPYSHSGGMGTGMLLPVVGIVSAAVAAFLYAYINVYSPVGGYVSIVFVGLLAAGAAFPVAFAAKILKCRNEVMLRINGIGTGVIAVYMAWAFFIYVLVAKEGGEDVPPMWDVVTAPDAIWEIASAISETGWYTIGSMTPTGVVLWIFWLIEAVIVIGASFLLSTHFVAGRAYCEICDVWCEPKKKEVIVPVVAGKMIKSVKTEGLAGLQEIPSPDTETNRMLQIYEQACPRCREFELFGANQVHMIAGKRSEPEASVEPIIPFSITREEDRADIDRIAAALKEARAKQFEKVKTKDGPKDDVKDVESVEPG